MKEDRIGFLFLGLTVLFFSTYEVVNKSISSEINLFAVNFIRFFIGGIILFIFLYKRKDLIIARKDFLICILAGILNVCISMSLISASLIVPGARASVVAVICIKPLASFGEIAFESNPLSALITAKTR